MGNGWWWIVGNDDNVNMVVVIWSQINIRIGKDQRLMFFPKLVLRVRVIGIQFRKLLNFDSHLNAGDLQLDDAMGLNGENILGNAMGFDDNSRLIDKSKTNSKDIWLKVRSKVGKINKIRLGLLG